jgi:hypothetical protein
MVRPRWRRGWREGAWPRRIFSGTTSLSDAEPPLTGQVRWSGYGRRRTGIGSSGSRRCGTTSTRSTAFGRRTSASGRMRRRGWTARRGRRTGRTWRLVFRTCRVGSGEAAIVPSRLDASTYRSRTDGNVRSGCRRWRTRSSSERPCRYCRRSTKSTSKASRTASGRDAGRTMRWTPWRWASRNGR